MFSFLFQKTKNETVSEAVALGALLIRAARIDGNFEAHEREAILALLKRRYGDSDAMIEAESFEANATDLTPITNILKTEIDFEDRASVLEDLWTVILSDNVRDDDENALARLVTHLLGLEDRDSAFARQKAASLLASD